MTFSAYLRFGRAISRDGPPVASARLPRVRAAPDAAEAFRAFDTGGRMPAACRQPRVLSTVLRGKASLNLHITEIWGSALRGMIRDGFPRQAYLHWNELQDAYPWLPRWVWRALAKQAGGK